MNPLVSIITPCYNGKGKVNIFLDSVLKQTYDNIEFIIINDGSTDNTEEIILSYKNKFINKGYKFIYLKQKNAGQDIALNNGLKYFTGKYLMWSDSDDILEANNIEEKVKYLEKNKTCGLVYCNTNIVQYKEINKVITKWDKILYKDRLKDFDDIFAGNIIFAGGAWMLRSEYFERINPKKEIVITGQGQNLQMLLPMAYNYDVGKVDKYLFTYVLYSDSHSNKKRTYEESIRRLIDIDKGTIEILKESNMEENMFYKYKKIIEIRHINEKFRLSLLYRKNKETKELYRLCKERNINLCRKNKIKYYLNLFGLYTILKEIKDKLK